MRRSFFILLAAALLAAPATIEAQTARRPARKPAARPAPAPRKVVGPADAACPQVLGVGVGSKLRFCDVMTGRTPADGILVHLPPHRGTLVFTFDLHNRHTYSDQEVRAGKGYAGYTATVAVVAPDSTIVGRGLVQSDFRTSRDLLDRISGGAGPRGVKAVAPVGTERIRLEVPQDVNELSLLGEKLTVVRLEGNETFTIAGPSRPIALVSNMTVEYVPVRKPVVKAPVKKKAPARRTPAKKATRSR